MKVPRLSALLTGRLYPPGGISGTVLFQEARPKGYCAAGRITSIQNLNDPIGNRTRDLLVCSL